MREIKYRDNYWPTDKLSNLIGKITMKPNTSAEIVGKFQYHDVVPKELIVKDWK